MKRNGAQRSGVTLLEVVLGMALMVPVLSLLFWFYTSTLETRDSSAQRVRRTQLARVIVDRIARELRQATGFSSGFRSSGSPCSRSAPCGSPTSCIR